MHTVYSQTVSGNTTPLNLRGFAPAYRVFSRVAQCCAVFAHRYYSVCSANPIIPSISFMCFAALPDRINSA
jgi:hypothetical protein